MLKRKLIIDQKTVKAYKELIAAGITPPETVPEIVPDPEPIRQPKSRRKPSKTRGDYFIYGTWGVKSISGYIMDIDGLKVGTHKVGERKGYWDITDIRTGVLIGNAPRLDAVPDIVETLRKILEERRNSDFMRKAEKTITSAYNKAA